MEPLDFGGLPPGALRLVDPAPILYVLENHRLFGPRFALTFTYQSASDNQPTSR